MSFTHLHCHTGYSQLDGAQSPKNVAKRAKDLGQEAIAITDHGTLAGIIKFWDACKAEEIIPILGMEAYFTPFGRDHREVPEGMRPAFHLVLLAKDKTGLHNLYKLSSRAYFEGFYYRPRVDYELLKEYREGLVCLGGCLYGLIQWYISKYLESNDKQWLELAKDEAKRMQEIFGEDFYMEFQRIIPVQDKIIPYQVEICKALNIKGVATCDAHYSTPQDVDFHEQLICLSTGKKLTDEDRMGKFEGLYIKSEEEMKTLWSDHPYLIDNTQEILEKCRPLANEELFKSSGFIIPNMTEDDDETLASIARSSLKRRKLDNEEYIERLEYELTAIKDMNFSSYFLLVADYVNWARNNKIIPGPGRGSGSGSLVAYCAGITDVDPIPNSLIFERFLNPGRADSSPDFDIDFPAGTGELVEQYIKEKHGEERVAKIPTYVEFKPRGAIRDFNRVFGQPIYVGDKASALVPPPKYGREPTWAEVREQAPALFKGDFKPIVEAAERSEGLVRHSGIHAAGLVIADRDITDICPCALSGKDKVKVTQWDMEELERIGLVKMDILKISTLKWIETCIEYIKQTQNIDIDISQIPHDDKKTFDLICGGNTNGLFQLDGGGGIRDLCIQLQPRSSGDLSIITSLYRPGPIETGMLNSYVKRKQGLEEVTYLIPELESLLKETYGIWVFQESVINATVKLAGYSLAEADKFRKIVGKKKVELIQEHKAKFVKGCKANRIKEDKASEIFEEIKGFSSYGFNRAHAYAYSVITYYTAYLKANYPLEYYCSLLTNHYGERDKLVTYLNDCRMNDIQVLGPDVNESDVGFSISNGVIRFGLSAIKEVGDKIAPKIVREKRNGRYKDIFDFYERLGSQGINKRTIEALAKGGALASLEAPRAGILEILDDLVSHKKEIEKYENRLGTYKKRMAAYNDRETERQQAKEAGIKVRPSLKLPQEPENPKEVTMPEISELSIEEIMHLEKEMLGVYITSHPLYSYELDILRHTNAHTASLNDHSNGSIVTMIGVISNIKDITTRQGKKMAVIDLEDLHGHVQVTVFPKLHSRISNILQEENVIILNGKIEASHESIHKIIAMDIQLLPPKKAKTSAELRKARITIGDGKKLNREILEKIKRIMEMYPGPIPIELSFYIEGTKFEITPQKLSSNGIEQLKKLPHIKVEAR